MSDESERAILTPSQREYLKKGDQFIQENDYTEGYADVLESRIRDRFYRGISDLDLLLQYESKWRNKTTDSLDEQNPRLKKAIEDVRTRHMEQLIWDILRDERGDIDAYGAMLQDRTRDPPDIDTSPSLSADVAEHSKELQDEFNIEAALQREGTIRGPVGSILEELLPLINRTLDWESLQNNLEPQNSALRFTLLEESGNPVERFTLAVQWSQNQILMADQMNAEFTPDGDVVARQEYMLSILDPEKPEGFGKARYQDTELGLYVDENNSREAIWLYWSTILESFDTAEFTNDG